MGKIKAFLQSDVVKKATNRKIVLGVTAILFAVIFIAITSFIPFAFSKDKLSTAKFWTDELIIIAITIFAMISCLYIGQAGNAQDERSNLAKARVKFKNTIELITNVNAFCQWIKTVLQPKDIQAIKERELRKIGIDDYSILKLEDAEIIELGKAPQKYNGRYYSKINEEQVLAILELKDGVKRIHLVEPNYYLTVSSIESDKTYSEKSGREQQVKTIRLVFSVVSKIVLTLIPACLFAMLVVDLTQKDGNTAQAWATFASRMFALITSAFYGYIIGCKTNDIDADYINLKSQIHEMYYQDKEFKPLDQQELARKEYIDRVKNDNIEYSRTLGFDEKPEPTHEMVVVKDETKTTEPVKE